MSSIVEKWRAFIDWQKRSSRVPKMTEGNSVSAEHSKKVLTEDERYDEDDEAVVGLPVVEKYSQCVACLCGYLLYIDVGSRWDCQSLCKNNAIVAIDDSRRYEQRTLKSILPPLLPLAAGGAALCQSP